MIKHHLENINLDDPISKNINVLIEFFVKFYGEKYRARITSKLKNTTFIIAERLDSDNTLIQLNNYFLKLKEKVISYFYKNAKLNLPIFEFEKMDINEIKKDIENYENKPLDNVTYQFLYALLDLNDQSERQNLDKLLQDRSRRENILNQIGDIEEEYYFAKENIDYLNGEFQKYSSKYIENIKKSEQIKEKYNDLEAKIIKNYLCKTFNIEEKNFPNEYISVYKNITNGKVNGNNTLLFLKFLALNTKFEHKTVEEFLDDKNFLGLLINDDVNFEIFNLEHNKVKELEQTSPSHLALQKVIEEKQLDPLKLLNTLDNHLTHPDNVIAYVEHTYQLKNPMNLHSICVLPPLFELDNATLIHEINHIISSDILMNTDWMLSIKSGIHEQYFNKEINENLGNFSMNCLNEVINDYISLQIDKTMKKKGFCLGKHTYKMSAFVRAFPLLKDFMDENLEELKECFISSDPNLIFTKFGKREIENLASAIRELLCLENSSNIKKELTSKLKDNSHILEILNDTNIDMQSQGEDIARLYNIVADIKQKIKIARANKNAPSHSKNKNDENSRRFTDYKEKIE